MSLLTVEWVKEQIDAFFAITSRTPQETSDDLDELIEHIRILQDALKNDIKNAEAQG